MPIWQEKKVVKIRDLEGCLKYCLKGYFEGNMKDYFNGYFKGYLEVICYTLTPKAVEVLLLKKHSIPTIFNALSQNELK